MKQVKTLMAGILLGSAVFTACNKANYNAVPDNSTSASALARSVDNSGGMFTQGYVNATHIGVRSRGAILTEFNDRRNWNLFDLLANAGLPLPADKYADLETTLDIIPADGQPALLLSGTRLPVDEAGNTGEAVQVTFMINTPLRLVSRPAVIELTENSNLLNLLNVNLDRLTEGIPAEMWQRALDPATGSILVSDQRNPELYLFMLRNLGGMLELLPPNNPTPSASSADAIKLTLNQK